MKKLFILFFCALSTSVSAQSNYLQVDNLWWYVTPMSIDTLVFEIKPKGLYAEVGMYFDFSVRGTEFEYYSEQDSLEIQMGFTLPENVEVTDMWLWVFDSCVHAGMYDRWTATQIYEGYVTRRTDPALLYKDNYSNGDDHYTFRIFPMLVNMPRKAKITYLVPIEDLLSNNPHIPLPLNIIKLSALNILECKIKYYPDAGMGAPLPADYFNFTLVSDSEGDYYVAEANDILGSGTPLETLTLSMQNTAQDNLFAGTFEDTEHNDKFFQMQIKPEEIFNIEQNKKALILFDFIDNNSSMSAQQVINGLKSQILNNFDENDSINIMISGMVTNVLNSNWLPCDSTTITDLFDNISPSQFSNFTNLPTLFIDGIDFVQTHGNDANIILISSANNHASLNEANSLMENIFAQMGSNQIPIHTIDLDNVNSSNEGYYIGNYYYRGNEYLYTILAAQTGAYFMQLYDYSYSEMLETVSNRLGGYLTSFDVFVNLEQGFTYANYEIGQSSNLTWVNDVYSIVGKYTGSGNFRIIASGESPDGELYYNELIVDGSNVQTLDNVTRSLWAGQQIREMYTYTQNNTVVSQIIYTSMGERVLSYYTAFLALEPGEGQLNEENNNNTGLNEDAAKNAIIFEVYPNPATEVAFINYYLPYDAQVTIEIFDLFGKRLAMLDNANRQGGNYKLEINTTEFETGTYICRMVVDNTEVITRKLVVVK